MKYLLLRLFSIVFPVLLSSSILYSGNGIISGSIKDISGKPVRGVSVLIKENNSNSISDTNGQYHISNIIPGKYTLIFNSEGYLDQIYKNVTINSDNVTILSISLESEPSGNIKNIFDCDLKTEGKDTNNNFHILSKNKLESHLPASTTYEILQTIPGVYKGFIRGAKQNQTKTLIEGVDISDHFYAEAADQNSTVYLKTNRIMRHDESIQSIILSPNINSISEMNVFTGTPSAEYMSSSGGLINYTLKEGNGPIKGSLNFRSSLGKLKYVGPGIYNDDSMYFKEKTKLMASTDQNSQTRAKIYTYQRDMYEIGKNSYDMDLSLHGSLLDDLGFYFSSSLKDNPNSRLPNQNFKKITSQLKLNYKFSPAIDFTGFGILDDRGKLFGWKNTNYEESMRFFLQGVPQSDGLSWVGSLKMTHHLSDITYYEIQLSNVNDNSRKGFIDANNDGIIQLNEKGDFLTFDTYRDVYKFIGSPPKFFEAGPSGGEMPLSAGSYGVGYLTYRIFHPGLFYENITTNTFSSKIDFTSQIDINHEFKTGLLFKIHSLDMQRVASLTYGYGRNYVYEKWTMKPLEFSIYGQDQIEYSGISLNAGVRIDMFDVKAKDIGNWFNPYVYENVSYSDSTFREKVPLRADPVKPFWSFSPRISISHPVSDKAVFFYSFSMMNQPQPFSMLYSNYNDAFYAVLPKIAYLASEPYKTTNYEVGAEVKLAEKLVILLNTYYKVIENYNVLSFQVITRDPSLYSYKINFSGGYARCKGLEFQFEALPINVLDLLNISGRVSYNYSSLKVTQESGSGDGSQYIFDVTKGDSSRFSSGLPFSDVNYYNPLEQNPVGGQSDLTSGYDRAHKIYLTLVLWFPYDISLTALGAFQSGFYYARTDVNERVKGRELSEGPWNSQIDLRLEKSFLIQEKYKITIYSDIKNLLDKHNIVAYDNTTTGADVWEEKQNPAGQMNRPIGNDGTLFYGIPREAYFGVSIEF